MSEKTLHKAPSKAGLTQIIDRRDYLGVAATGRKWVTSAFVLQAREVDAQEPVAVGFTTSKKVGNAVERNKARRRLKEAARSVFKSDTYNGWQFIVIARHAAIHYPFERLIKDMKWASSKIIDGADLKDDR